MRLQYYFFSSILLIAIIFCLSRCSTDENLVIKAHSAYATENVILVVIDGPRLSETWHATDKSLIQNQRALAEEGIFFDNFYNDGVTFTLSGHTAITTGRYDLVHNNGKELPDNHSIFQQYLASTQSAPDKAWIITSKSKLHALGDTKESGWRSSYLPSLDTQDRTDQETLASALQIFNDFAPRLALIHFREPDSYGHGNNWPDYIKSIRSTDQYVKELWEYLQSNHHYKGKTTLMVTNDHGRHLDGIGSGFVGHGDLCEGCRHISLLAIGPDFKKNQTVSATYGQVDIAPTVATLLNFLWSGEGQSITELTK